MSAFIVSHRHIDALLTYANEQGAYFWKHGDSKIIKDLTKIGNILLAENYRAYNTRYPTHQEAFENDYYFRFYGQSPKLTPVEIIKGCACFDYQACEATDYERSDAAWIINAIRQCAIRNLPGWNEARGWDFQ